MATKQQQRECRHEVLRVYRSPYGKDWEYVIGCEACGAQGYCVKPDDLTFSQMQARVTQQASTEWQRETKRLERAARS